MAEQSKLSTYQPDSIINASPACYLKLALEKSYNTVRDYKADVDCYTAWLIRMR